MYPYSIDLKLHADGLNSVSQFSFFQPLKPLCIGLVSGVVFVFEFNVSLLISYTVSLLLRSFLVPANIVLSHDNISQIFVDSVKDLLDDFTAKIMNVGRVTWNFLKSLKSPFNSNQVSPEEIEEGT